MLDTVSLTAALEDPRLGSPRPGHLGVLASSSENEGILVQWFLSKKLVKAMDPLPETRYIYVCARLFFFPHKFEES